LDARDVAAQRNVAIAMELEFGEWANQAMHPSRGAEHFDNGKSFAATG
jgi:hypothetical protein